MEMGKLLEQGSAGIKSMADNIESGLIVTEQAAAASKKYYAAVDKLTDAWNAFKYTVGNAVIPVLTDLIDGQGTVEDQLKAQANTLQNTGGIWGNYGKSAAQVKTELAGVNGQLSNMQWGQAYAQLTLATGGQQGFADVTQTTTEEIISEVSALKDLTPQFLFNKAAANLDADAAMTLATNMGLIDKKAVVASKVLDTLSAMQAAGDLTGNGYALAVERLYKNIDKLQDKSIDVIVNVITRGRVPVQGSGWGGMPGVEDTPRPPDPYSGHHATGINTVVPAGFNDNYPMFFKSGEKVKATPAGQTDNDMAMVISKLDKLPSAIAKAVRDGMLLAAA
jgi:hypothetical protein